MVAWSSLGQQGPKIRSTRATSEAVTRSAVEDDPHVKILDDFGYLMIEQYASPGVTHFRAAALDSALPTFELSTQVQREEAANKIVAFVVRALRNSLEIKNGSLWTAAAKERERDRLLALAPTQKTELDRLLSRAKRVMAGPNDSLWIELSDGDPPGAPWLFLGPVMSLHLD
jgi:hypothetical protein